MGYVIEAIMLYFWVKGGMVGPPPMPPMAEKPAVHRTYDECGAAKRNVSARGTLDVSLFCRQAVPADRPTGRP